MRLVIWIVLLLATVTGNLHAQGERRRGGRSRDRDVATVALKNLTYQRVEFETKSVTTGKANYAIYLPVGYAAAADADHKYPWVIWLHGMSEDDRDFHFGGAAVVDEAIGSGKLTKVIFVAAAAPSRTLYANGELGGNVADLILKDLVAHVQANYRVSPERKDRALMGVSLGGMAALRFALASPESFGAVATHSAAVFPEDPTQLPDQHRATVDRYGDRAGWFELLGNPIDPVKYAALNPTSLAHTITDVKGLRIYFDAGTDDRYGFGPANQHLSDVLKEQGIAHTFRLIEGGQHSWGGGTIQKALVDSLTFVNEGFTNGKAASAPTAPTGGGGR